VGWSSATVQFGYLREGSRLERILWGRGVDHNSNWPDVGISVRLMDIKITFGLPPNFRWELQGRFLFFFSLGLIFFIFSNIYRMIAIMEQEY